MGTLLRKKLDCIYQYKYISQEQKYSTKHHKSKHTQHKPVNLNRFWSIYMCYGTVHLKKNVPVMSLSITSLSDQEFLGKYLVRFWTQ